jgi:uncharacterized protein involved in exopolysaccharide biosynthesis
VSVVNYHPRSFTSTTSFVPQPPSGTASSLPGLAAQLGLAVPAVDPSQSPAFYADLLKSREVLRQAVLTTYAFTAGGTPRRGTLVELLAISGSSDALKEERAMRRLSDAIVVTRRRETGVIRVAVQAPWAELAQQLAERLMILVNEFNLERRQSQATAERQFIQGRLGEANAELLQAETRLQRFLTANRDYRNSPTLQFERDRMEQEVIMRRQITASLTQAHEQARIDEVRNTSVVTVIEPAHMPVAADARGFIKNVLLGATLGLMLFVASAFARESSAQRRAARDTRAIL